MKNSKKTFILIETVLAVMVLLFALLMLLEKNGQALEKVSVIVQDSDDGQWAAFKYGLRMAAADQNLEVAVISTGGILTAAEEEGLIESEINNGADAVIVQPSVDSDAEAMLVRIQNNIPVMLVGCTASCDAEKSTIPTTEPDHYAMGRTLAEELLDDYSGKLEGKSIGIVSETESSASAILRESGFRDRLEGTGAQISWKVADTFEEGSAVLENQPKTDFVIALDDSSLVAAGACSAANNLHGAVLYGIGNSTEAIYYLDTGIAECLVVPDDFNVGYQSLTEVAKSLRHLFHKMEGKTVSYTVIRRDELFTKENQEILFTMSQ